MLLSGAQVEAETKRTNCLKCFLIFLTTLLMLIGIGLFGAIGLIKLRYSESKGVNMADIGVIVFASLLCLVAMVGYWGASQNNTTVLKLFIFLIVFLTCITIVIDVMAFTQPQVAEDLLQQVWGDFNDHGRIQFQKLFLCCDVLTNNTGHRSSRHTSCFKNDIIHENNHVKVTRSNNNIVTTFKASSTAITNLKRKDCVEALVDFLHKYMNLISGILGGVMVLNVVIVFLSCMLVIDRTEDVEDQKSRHYNFPITTDVILWKRRENRRLTQPIESGMFELPPTYPTAPILQAYKNSIDKSVRM